MFRSKYNVTVFSVGLLLVILTATAGAYASHYFDFEYTVFTATTLFVYALVSYLITNHSGRKAGIIAPILLGLVDSTLGWKLSEICLANTTETYPENTLKVWFTLVGSMLVFTTIVGAITSWITLKFKTR